MLSRAAVNSLGDMVFPYGTPLLVLLFCIGGLSSNYWCIFHSGILEAKSVLLEFALSRRLPSWDNIFSAYFLHFGFDMDVVDH